MSDSSEKGKSLETHVAKLLQKKLGARVARDKRSGAGSHQKMDITNFYGDMPLSIEVKNHKTIAIREWWRQATAGSSIREVPTVVFQADDDVLAVLRFDDLVNFLSEIQTGEATIELLRTPLSHEIPRTSEEVIGGLKEILGKTEAKTCRNGHIVMAGSNRCLSKGCPFSAGYKAKKVKK